MIFILGKLLLPALISLLAHQELKHFSPQVTTQFLWDSHTMEVGSHNDEDNNPPNSIEIPHDALNVGLGGIGNIGNFILVEKINIEEHARCPGRPRTYSSSERKQAANQRRREARQDQMLRHLKSEVHNLRNELKLKADSFEGTCSQPKLKFQHAITNEKMKVLKQENNKLRLEVQKLTIGFSDLGNLSETISALVSQEVAQSVAKSVAQLVVQRDDFKSNYVQEMEKSKNLFNLLQEAKGNIRVFCRCRPLNLKEISSSSTPIVDLEAAEDGELGLITKTSTKKIFKFDRVYTLNADQSDVYADASPLVISVLDGYNVCIFAYGQSGTGKMYTMEGTVENRGENWGVNYRTLEELFKVVGDRKDLFDYDISVSFLEVYNEQIRDLLPLSPASNKIRLELKAAAWFHHAPILEAKVHNLGDVWTVLDDGKNARAVGSTNLNEHSSRSHCMLCIMVKTVNLVTCEVTQSKFWLVDLAGSERLAKSDAQGERLKETQHINRSLSALGDVMFALSSKRSHVSYRNSKLTYLLQDSLGGSAKTLMFVQISLLENDTTETLSSLNFGSRVSGISLGPTKKAGRQAKKGM
ncbi:Kinesin-4 [Platanthera zijinensis]|uniref:Kinesin-like protein n=1 Tax=Platanthera zijinensis TaxID=2320716 RepID=A0AAP0FZY2_9ASPA